MFDGTGFIGLSGNATGSVADDGLGQLLRRCAERDPQALKAIYDAMAPTMLGVALRLLRNRPHAEETLQDAFLQIWRNADRYDQSRGSPKAWMIGILRYRALDRLETERRHTGTDELPDVAADMPVGIEDSRALATCIEELPETWRKSVMLSYVEGYSHSEIAERTDTPLGTVKSWIVRALAALKKCMER
jgi:RNA polymerase sigma factor, sigma-70 family